MRKIATVLLWPFATLFVLGMHATRHAVDLGRWFGLLVGLLTLPLRLPLVMIGVLVAIVATPIRLAKRRKAFARCSEAQRERLTDFVAAVRCAEITGRAVFMEPSSGEICAKILRGRAKLCFEAGITPAELCSFVPLHWRELHEYISRLPLKDSG